MPGNLQSLRGIGATLLWTKVIFDLAHELTTIGADTPPDGGHGQVVILVVVLIGLTVYLRALRGQLPSGPPAAEAIP